MIDNNKNSQISEQDDEPTVELEQLSEAAFAEIATIDDSPDRSDSVSDNASEVQELRDELKFRVEMNSILQHGIDQLREKCDGRAAQVASLEHTSEKVSYELEQSRRQLEETRQELAKARESEKALIVDLKELGNADAANAVAVDQGGTIEELRKDNLALTGNVTNLEAELKSKAAQIDNYESEIAALRRTLRRVERTSPDRAPAARRIPDSQPEDRWVLVGLDSDASGVYVIGDGMVTIGSGPDSDIQIQSKFISRHHAQLINTHSGCVLGDLNSTNGTFINSRRISKRVLKGDDIVTIGKHRFRYEKQAGKSIGNRD